MQAHGHSLSNSQFLVELGLRLCWLSFASSLLLVFWLDFDRWRVRRAGKPGVATIEACEIVRYLPSPVYELELSVQPDDRSEIDFRRRVRWKRSEVDPQRLVPGELIPVRFRRAPRPLVLPR